MDDDEQVPKEHPTLPRTITFVDLAGFTALTDAHGDQAAVRMIERFELLTRESLAVGDQLVKTIGDAVMLAHLEPTSALECVDRIFIRCLDETDFPVPRAGLHHGEAIRRNGDWFGATVNLAARVAGLATGGQALVTTGVADVGRSMGLRIVGLGCFDLRNITERVELWEVHFSSSQSPVVVDPVCRMNVDTDTAAGRLRYGEVDYWFCSLRCAGAFLEKPRSYATDGAAGNAPRSPG